MNTIVDSLEKDHRIARETPSQDVIDWLETLELDSDVLEQLKAASYQAFVKVNKISFSRLNDIKSENLDPQNIDCISNGYLIIGAGLNGDPVVYSLATKTVGFVSHDELWEDDEVEFEEIVSVTSFDIPTFFDMARQDIFPVDFFECYEYLHQGS